MWVQAQYEKNKYNNNARTKSILGAKLKNAFAFWELFDSFDRFLRATLGGFAPLYSYAHRETERSPQPLGRVNVLYCHNKSLNKQQEQMGGGSSNSTSVVNTKAEHDANADVDVGAGVAAPAAASAVLHSAYRAEFPV